MSNDREEPRKNQQEDQDKNQQKQQQERRDRAGDDRVPSRVQPVQEWPRPDRTDA